jgi:hypothetical protein
LASEFPAEPVYPLTADYALRVGAATDYFQKWDYAQKRSTSALAEHLERDPLVASKDIILLALQNKTFDETFTEEKLVTARQAHQGSKRQKKASGENEATSIELRREIAKLQQQLDAKTATETPQVEVPRVEGMDIDQDGVNSVSTPLPEGEGENPAGGNNTAGRPQQLATTARRTRPLCNKHGHQKRQFDMD